MKRLILSSRNFLFINSFSILFITLQACSNQQLGKDLSESFDSSEELLLRVDSSKEIDKLPKKLKDNNSLPNAIPQKRKKLVRKINQPKLLINTSKINQSKLQDYLLVIKIFGANPSAPGEKITNALRSQGVEFEVQRIEKIDNKSDKKLKLLNNK